jgi:pimeloyl-ACP methyl ester carboxylesterase
MTPPHPPFDLVEKVTTSADGTRIGYLTMGQGPGLVMVHGSIATSTEWLDVAKHLAPQFTCYLMDRRGRGRSGVGSEPYGIDREYDDISAVLTEAGPGTSLLGHSFGAICALGAALQTPVARLALYEPPLPVGGPVAGDYLDEYRWAVEAKQPDEALSIGLLHVVRLPPPVVQAMRASPAWKAMLSLVPTWIRELSAIDALTSPVGRYAAIRCPVQLLVGTKSAEHPLQVTSRALAQVIPQVRVTALEGQGHMATRTAPALLARQVLSFLTESAS